MDAEDRAWDRALRPKDCLLATNEPLRVLVAEKLAEDWSPKQIAGYLSKTQPAGAGMRISHESIYKSLFMQTRKVLAKELRQHLRSGRPTRRNIRYTSHWTHPVGGDDHAAQVDAGQQPAERGGVGMARARPSPMRTSWSASAAYRAICARERAPPSTAVRHQASRTPVW
ncbi:hypothetical protein OHV05_36700 (plasmid) [Kitasatospora sp. NBC_00070]